MTVSHDAVIIKHMRHDILFTTPHGSHLYGLSNEGSDEDYYLVYPDQPRPNSEGATKKTNVLQNNAGGLDITTADLNSFALAASAGVPQALEAMFSQKARIDRIRAYRASFHVSIPSMSIRYKHAIEKFSTYEFKRRRHALRYALNLREAYRNAGRFNPTLSQNEIDFLNEESMSDSYIATLRSVSPVELELNIGLIQSSMEIEGV